MRTSGTIRTKNFSLFVVVILVALLGAGLSKAQAPAYLAQIKSVYVEPFDNGSEGPKLQRDLTKWLHKSGGLRVVDKPGDADATLKGNGQIWVKGYVTTNPRSPANNRQAVYGGFLSVELFGKDGQPLWSYLVTPSKFSWYGITDDLARSLAKEFALARSGGSSATVATSAGKQNLAAAILSGAGATFPAPLYQKWFESLQRIYPQVRVGYQAVGSEAGMRMLNEGAVDFAASDVSSAESLVHGDVKYRRIASVLGAVVPIYNLKSSTRDLHLTPEALADIYSGKLTKWNDPRIADSNRGFDLPDADIVVVHRSDGSGTTYAWSDYLSKVSSNWKASVGTGTTLNWPTGTGAAGNEGVAAMVQKTPNSIGYVELAYAIQHRLSFGAVRNRAGEFVHADLRTVIDAAKSVLSAAAGSNGANVGGSSSGSLGSLGSITDATGRDAYPIASFTWLIFPERIDDGAKKAALFAFLQWLLTSGQKECSSLGYAPLPPEITTQQLNSLNSPQ